MQLNLERFLQILTHAIVRTLNIFQQSRRPANNANLLRRVLLSEVSRSLNARGASANYEHRARRLNLALSADAFDESISSSLPLVELTAPRRRVRGAGAYDECIVLNLLRLQYLVAAVILAWYVDYGDFIVLFVYLGEETLLEGHLMLLFERVFTVVSVE